MTKNIHMTDTIQVGLSQKEKELLAKEAWLNDREVALDKVSAELAAKEERQTIRTIELHTQFGYLNERENDIRGKRDEAHVLEKQLKKREELIDSQTRQLADEWKALAAEKSNLEEYRLTVWRDEQAILKLQCDAHEASHKSANKLIDIRAQMNRLKDSLDDFFQQERWEHDRR
jgi:predicted nuclease with TOPRIM domain